MPGNRLPRTRPGKETAGLRHELRPSGDLDKRWGKARSNDQTPVLTSIRVAECETRRVLIPMMCSIVTNQVKYEGSLDAHYWLICLG